MLRMRTEYSFRTAIGSIEECLAMTDPQRKFLPITDRGSSYGWYEWEQAVKARNSKACPVLGLEIAVTPDPAARRPIKDHWLFFTTPQSGIADLGDAMRLAYQQHKYEPLLTYEQALDYSSLIKVMGYKSLFREKSKNLYAGLSPALSYGQLKAYCKAGVPLASTAENVFPAPGQQGEYSVICGRGASSQSYPQHILTQQELGGFMARHRFVENEIISEAHLNAVEVLEQASLPTLGQGQLPSLGYDTDWQLEEWCKEAIPQRIPNWDASYQQRLEKELSLITQKKFSDYFCIVADMCRFAKQSLGMLVGPARGSSCGSLVCYLLGITEIDPLQHGLIFERFVDLNRADLPDIDIDFSDAQRHLVYEYLQRTYRPECVSRLGTVSIYRPRSALREACGALKIPLWKADNVIDSLIERSSGDARALDTLEDTLKGSDSGRELLGEFPEIEVACSMEGRARHSSTHASAVIVSEHPLRELMPVVGENDTLMMDKKTAEQMGLLKIDVLGLTQLSILEEACDACGMPVAELYSLPLDDATAYKVLENRNWAGIFQFNGEALQLLAQQVAMNCFNDIVSITAIARPGPLVSGNATKWVQRRSGKGRIEYPHPLLKPYLEDTFGIVIYQEQVMQIGREIGDLSWEQVTQLRKAMSKSLGKEYFDQFGDPFKAAAIKKGIPSEVIEPFWDQLCNYGSWSFNKSHAVAYGMISYWCCWMKAHHPFEFAAATLNHEPDTDRQLMLLRELHREDIHYKAIDKDASTNRWTVSGQGSSRMLIGPLTNVHGIGPRYAATIMGARARGEPLSDSLKKKLDKAVTPIDSLWPIADGIRKVCPDLKARNIHSRPMSIDSIGMDSNNQEVLVLCTPATINVRDLNEAIMVARRGGREIRDGSPTKQLNLKLKDDSGIIFAKIKRFQYTRLGRPIVQRGRPNKALYAIKGRVWSSQNYRELTITRVRYLGDIETGAE